MNSCQKKKKTNHNYQHTHTHKKTIQILTTYDSAWTVINLFLIINGRDNETACESKKLDQKLQDLMLW